MNFLLSERVIEFGDFKINAKEYDILIDGYNTMAYSYNEKFFVAFVSKTIKGEYYLSSHTMKALKNVILAGQFASKDYFMYVVRQSKENMEFKTVMLILRIIEDPKYGKIYERLSEKFLRSELQRLELYLGEVYLENGIVYIYSQTIQRDPASFLLSQLNV